MNWQQLFCSVGYDDIQVGRAESSLAFKILIETVFDDRGTAAVKYKLSMSSGSSAVEYEKYYKLLGLKPGATEKDVSTAYRSKALRLHPDKNRDDPRAQEKFHEIQQAYQILSDPAARSAYEELVNLRRDREEKRAKLDVKRRAMQDDLLDRERAAKRQAVEQEKAEAALKARINRLREDALRAEESQKFSAEILNKSTKNPTETYTLIIQGLKSGSARSLLQEYDPSVHISSDSGSSETFATFSTLSAAETVLALSKSGNLPFTASWLSKPAEKASSFFKISSNTSNLGKLSIPAEAAGTDFESQILAKMKQAQAKKSVKPPSETPST